MANYTILANSEKNNRSEVVIEFPVPVGDNTVEVPWRTIVAELRAVEQALSDAIATVNPRKLGDTTYLAKLDAGEVYELALSVEYDANKSNAEKLALLDTAVVDRVAEFEVEFLALYQFYGYVGGS